MNIAQGPSSSIFESLIVLRQSAGEAVASGNVALASSLISSIVSGVNELKFRQDDVDLLSGPTSPSKFQSWMVALTAVYQSIAEGGFADDVQVVVSNTSTLKATASQLAKLPNSTVKAALYTYSNEGISHYPSMLKAAGDALQNALRQNNIQSSLISPVVVGIEIDTAPVNSVLTALSDGIQIVSNNGAMLGSANMIVGDTPILLRVAYDMTAAMDPVVSVDGTPVTMTAEAWPDARDRGIANLIVQGAGLHTFTWATTGATAAGDSFHITYDQAQYPIRKILEIEPDVVDVLATGQPITNLRAMPWYEGVMTLLVSCNVWASSNGVNYANKFAGWVPTLNGNGLDLEASVLANVDTPSGQTRLRRGLKYINTDWEILKGLFLAWQSLEA